MFQQIVNVGGLFAVLSFIHFFVDWIFQSHDEAMVKHYFQEIPVELSLAEKHLQELVSAKEE